MCNWSITFGLTSCPHQAEARVSFVSLFPHIKKEKNIYNKSAQTGACGAEALSQQESLDHLLGLLGSGVDVLQGICHGKLPVPQSVPVGQNIVVFKHLLVVSHRVVEFDQASIVVLQSTVTLSKKLLTCKDTANITSQHLHMIPTNYNIISPLMSN